jgi:predicted enzyme related to lactoylglutathione lyase
MPNSQSRFVWHHLATSDVDGAKSFYTQILPWKTQAWELDEDYTVFVNNDEPLGGVRPLEAELKTQGIAPHWMPYVCVYDVDACSRQVKTLGGQLRIGPTEIANGGCWAVVTDPQGAAIGLFEPEGQAPGHDGQPRRGEFSWHELMTTDYKAAADFYRALFRWEKTSEFDMGEAGIYHMFGKGGRIYGGMFNKPRNEAASWLSYARVDDVKGLAETVKKLGGKVIHGPTEVPGGDWIVACTDPQGAPFALHMVKA